MKIAIIGAGWFGCHLAVKLLEQNHNIRLFECTNDIFSGASGHNQNRLHLGYHYPRSYQTRREIVLYHDRFIKEYPTKEVKDNLFAISNESWIDLYSYLNIMKGDNICINTDFAHKYGIYNVEGNLVLRTKELVIDTESSKQQFLQKLNKYIQYGAKAYLIQKNRQITIQVLNGISILDEDIFDVVIDCTSGELNPTDKIFFEPAVMTEYEGPEEHFALTIMDGLFPCLYPTAKNREWRVSHVAHTARGSFDKFHKAQEVLDNLDPKEITYVMSSAMTHYYPDFLKYFHPKYSLVKAVRTKLKNNNASRECKVSYDGRILRVFSGKICSIFMVEDLVKEWLKTLE